MKMLAIKIKVKKVYTFKEDVSQLIFSTSVTSPLEIGFAANSWEYLAKQAFDNEAEKFGGANYLEFSISGNGETLMQFETRSREELLNTIPKFRGVAEQRLKVSEI